MKLKIQNMIGISQAMLTLDKPLTLICSDQNAAGKSTIQDAFRFVIGAGPRGINTKSGLKDCIREGAQSGKVATDFGGLQRVRNLRDGEYPTGGPLAGLKDNVGLPYGLDPERVGGVRGQALTKALQDAAGATLGPQELAEEIEKLDGVEGEHVDEVRPLLQGSLDGVIAHCREQASEARGAWKQLTGENFGAQKSDGWAPEKITDRTPEDLAESVEALHIRIAEVEPQARAQGITGPCPHCGEMVSYDGQRLLKTPKQEQSAPEMWEELQGLRAQLAEAERELEAATGADELAAEAQALYDRWKAFTAIAQGLQPGEIPSKIAAKAMEPVRHRLAQHASQLGWNVQVSASGEITVNGRIYELLTPSEQWRARVILAEVITYLAKTGVLLVDQFDIIAPQERGKWLKWFAAVSKSRTMMVAFAMREKPDPATKGGKALTGSPHWNFVWVENGGAECLS